MHNMEQLLGINTVNQGINIYALTIYHPKE